MKRCIGLMLIMGVFFMVGGCNTPTDQNPPPPPPPGDEDVVFNWGEPGYNAVPGNSDKYPGIMLALAECTDVTGTLGDISLYGTVIIDARLYANKADFDADPQVTVAQKNGLAHFKILPDGNWENELFPQGDNMKAAGETSARVPAGKTGDPVNVLVQTAVDSGVGYIEIRKLTFKLRSPDGTVELDKVYDNGSFMEVEGNTITFNNATGGDAAAVFLFPAEWGWTETSHGALSGKTITFTYRIPEHTCVPSSTLPAGTTTAEHQLRIQAAHNKEDKYNGNDNAGGTKPGQEYIDDLQSAGSFTVSANKMIAAAEANDAKGGPFVLNAVRIVNDGTTYQTYIRCKSYKLIFDSITIE